MTLKLISSMLADVRIICNIGITVNLFGCILIMVYY